MHGRPRHPSKPVDAVAAAAKVDNLRLLQTQLLHNHRHRVYTPEALAATADLLRTNPEVYTAWNFRRLAVDSHLPTLSDPDRIRAALDAELAVAEAALRQNPKCYGAWHHRRWVLGKDPLGADYDREFRLLDQLLKADSRNFHGWNYRRFIAASKNVSEESELKFVTDKINENLSNYSAWHNRSVLLSQSLNKKTQSTLPREEILEEEFELVHQALFTDPDDQSGWFYYLWLLDQTTASCDSTVVHAWPANGSNLVFSASKNVNDLVSLANSTTDYVLRKEKIPLFLHFSEPVKGIDSSTVAVQCPFFKNEDIKWQALSGSKSGEACYWVAHLDVSEVKFDASNAYTIEVVLGCSPGITSSAGSPFSSPYRFQFTLNVRCIGPKQERNLVKEMVSWEDGVTSSCMTLPKELECKAFREQPRTTEEHEPNVSKWHIETLSNELSLFRELLSDMDCKIAKLTVARLLVALDSMMSNEPLSMQNKTDYEEIIKLYDDLIESDPSHGRYHKDQRSVVLMNQVTCDKETLSKYCCMASKPSRFQNHILLRLNNMSLSRIGFTERLLWVQMLDLSDNELTSIEGLEALQFLSCLRLRGNKISSFTALEPLKKISSLEVLDISHNEIGAHRIDTTRYLCVSPLSHSMSSSWDEEKCRNDNINVADNWEAILFFQELQLVQLDIVGNAVATDEFRLMLVKLLPTLNWLDGSSM